MKPATRLSILVIGGFVMISFQALWLYLRGIVDIAPAGLAVSLFIIGLVLGFFWWFGRHFRYISAWGPRNGFLDVHVREAPTPGVSVMLLTELQDLSAPPVDQVSIKHRWERAGRPGVWAGDRSWSSCDGVALLRFELPRGSQVEEPTLSGVLQCDKKGYAPTEGRYELRLNSADSKTLVVFMRKLECT